ncbi:hypothetical protein Hanom_Chr11g00967481 [Helianthus anomalus]
MRARSKTERFFNKAEELGGLSQLRGGLLNWVSKEADANLRLVDGDGDGDGEDEMRVVLRCEKRELKSEWEWDDDDMEWMRESDLRLGFSMGEQ